MLLAAATAMLLAAAATAMLLAAATTAMLLAAATTTCAHRCQILHERTHEEQELGDDASLRPRAAWVVAIVLWIWRDDGAESRRRRHGNGRGPGLVGRNGSS
jgi:hypothetical protein